MKWPERDVGYSLSSTVGVESGWCYASTPPICLGVVDKDNLIKPWCCGQGQPYKALVLWTRTALLSLGVVEKDSLIKALVLWKRTALLSLRVVDKDSLIKPWF